MSTIDFPERHEGRDAHFTHALGATSSGQGREGSESLNPHALAGSDSATGAIEHASTTGTPRPSLFDPTLYMLASLLDDIEGIRKAAANRRQILTTGVKPDPETGELRAMKDGIDRAFHLDEDHPSVAVLDGLGSGLESLEHQAILALNRAMRSHPLAAFQKQAKGVGEKQLARLLAAIGDPYLRTMPDGSTVPRTVSQLWAYCGLHTLPVSHMTPDAHCGAADGGASSHSTGTALDPMPIQGSSRPGETEAARRRKGQQANWSTDAKTRAYLIATSCIKSGGEYRAVYDQRRTLTAATHPDWTPGHSHNDALRIVSKRILRDLWRAARDYHLPELKEQAA